MTEYEWDESKRRENREKHGIDFAAMELFKWDTALVERSDRNGEIRYGGLGYIDDLMYYAVFAERGDVIRIISLRRANAAERRRYDQTEI